MFVLLVLYVVLCFGVCGICVVLCWVCIGWVWLCVLGVGFWFFFLLRMLVGRLGCGFLWLWFWGFWLCWFCRWYLGWVCSWFFLWLVWLDVLDKCLLCNWEREFCGLVGWVGGILVCYGSWFWYKVIVFCGWVILFGSVWGWVVGVGWCGGRLVGGCSCFCWVEVWCYVCL